METPEGIVDASLCVTCDEICGIVIKHNPPHKWYPESIDVLIEDRIYTIHACDPPMVDEDPFFNLRVIPNDGTTTKF